MIHEFDIRLANDPAALPDKPEDTFRWATVVNLDPLNIRLDGESQPLAATPSALSATYSEGQRVWVQMHGRAIIVLGGANGEPVPPSTDTPWTQPTLKNGWTNVAFLNPVQYRMFHDVVHLRGLANNGTDGSAVFTLPTGFRPSGQLYFPGTGGASAGQIEVKTNGDVAMSGAPSGAFVFLDVVQFIPD